MVYQCKFNQFKIKIQDLIEIKSILIHPAGLIIIWQIPGNILDLEVNLEVFFDSNRLK